MLPESGNWRRLYAAAVLAGAGLGLLVALDVLPAIPPQLIAWLHSAENQTAALLVPVAGGALVGLALVAVAHLGVVWQLRRRSRASLNSGDP